MEHCLFRIEFGDWWQDTSCIAGQENDVGWVIVRYTRDLGVLDELDGIRTARVVSPIGWEGIASISGESPAGIFSQRRVIIVHSSSLCFEDNVLEDGPELDSIENVWLLLGR